MIRYLTIDDVCRLHEWSIQHAGGATGVRDVGLIESAIATPQFGFADCEFYSTIPEKAAVLGYSISQNQGFTDGNKRTGFYSMAVFAELNGNSLTCTAEEGERVFLAVAAGHMSKDEFIQWSCTAISPKSQ